MRRLSSKGKKGKAGKAGGEEKELGNDSDAQGNGSTAPGVGSDQEENGSEEAKVPGGKKSKRGKRSDQNPNSGNEEPEEDDEKPQGGRKKARGRKRNSKENDNTESNKRKRRSGNSESEQETSGKTEDEEEEEYEVERVVDCRVFKGVKQYKIRWKGYEEDRDTWEPEDELNCSDLIEEYLQEHPDAPKVTGKPAKAGRGRKAGKQSNNEGPKQKKSKREVAPVSEEDGQKVYEVEKVLEVHFKKNGEREFLIRWKGFTGEDDSWEPEKNLNCPELIEKFMKKVEVAKSASVRELRANPQTTSRYALDEAKGRRSRRNKGKNRATYYNSE